MARLIALILLFTLLPFEGVLCAASEEHGLSPAAVQVFSVFGFPISNSMIITWVVTVLLIVAVRVATHNMTLVPGKLQNFAEAIVEGLYTFFEGIVGNKVVKGTFWFFSAIFVYILATNWFSLIPGIGTVGWGIDTESGAFHVSQPLLRGGNADLNMTCAMAMLFFLFWCVWAFRYNGVKGVFKEIFGVKGGGVTGAMLAFLAIIFFLVGFLEVISICFRPISLMFRLYGNIYAGEVMMETMMAMGGQLVAILASLPVYILETLVGFIQAMVFALLTAVFTATMCTHEEEHA